MLVAAAGEHSRGDTEALKEEPPTSPKHKLLKVASNYCYWGARFQWFMVRCLCGALHGALKKPRQEGDVPQAATPRGLAIPGWKCLESEYVGCD